MGVYQIGITGYFINPEQGESLAFNGKATQVKVINVGPEGSSKLTVNGSVNSMSGKEGYSLVLKADEAELLLNQNERSGVISLLGIPHSVNSWRSDGQEIGGGLTETNATVSYSIDRIPTEA